MPDAVDLIIDEFIEEQRARDSNETKDGFYQKLDQLHMSFLDSLSIEKGDLKFNDIIIMETIRMFVDFIKRNL